MSLLRAIQPELILVIAASALFLLGVVNRRGARMATPVIALAALLIVFILQIMTGADGAVVGDATGEVRVQDFAQYIKLIAAGVGALLVLLAWPNNEEATGNSALDFGTEAGEFFALMLLSIAGVFLVAGANDLILLFLGIELASIPTYIMVSISRPLPVAQEAGVKYFFLGAMSAAVMLFGFSYLYGATGTTDISEIAARFASTLSTGSGIGRGAVQLSAWQMLAVVMVIAGFAFKIAAVPLHFYAGDVYQGAATPVTAFLSFVPKTSGMVALIKVLYMTGGGGAAASWALPPQIAKLLWVLAVLTMTIGNALGLLQHNVKRVLAYSSIAHSGYMLVGLATLAWAGSQGRTAVALDALQGVLFYLAAYGVMNVAVFGVLMMLPSSRNAARRASSSQSAETFEDLAGTGRAHPALGLAMSVACFSLIGIPLTVGFFGKFYLARPALDGHNYWLVVIMMINAAISAGYYLRIIGAMFLRPEPLGAGRGFEVPTNVPAEAGTPLGTPLSTPLSVPQFRSFPITLAIVLSVAGVLLFGAVPPATELLSSRSNTARNIDSTTSSPTEEPERAGADRTGDNITSATTSAAPASVQISSKVR